MLTPPVPTTSTWTLMAQAKVLPVAFDPAEVDLWLYRARTTALLRRYARASVEVGKLPSMLGGEIFRARLTSYAMKSFEDVVIFVADMERALDQLSQFDRRLLTMNVVEGYAVPEVSRLLRSPQRTVERQLTAALDELSLILVRGGILEIELSSRGKTEA